MLDLFLTSLIPYELNLIITFRSGNNVNFYDDDKEVNLPKKLKFKR